MICYKKKSINDGLWDAFWGLVLFLLFFLLGCRGNSQVLATYQDGKITRGMLRDMVHWYRQEKSAKNILWQKSTVKRIALTKILSKKAEEAKLHETTKVKEFEVFNHSKILSQLYIDKWRDKQEEIPETFYQLESIVISRIPPKLQKDDSEETFVEYVSQLREQIISSKKDMSELAKTIRNENGRARYIAPEYYPLSVMEGIYRTEIMKIIDPLQNSSSVSELIRMNSGWHIIRLKKTSSAVKSDFFNLIVRPQNESQALIILESYWERILQERAKDWRKTIFKKYDMDAEELPKLSKEWRKDNHVFKNDKISFIKKDFLIHISTMRKLSQESPDLDISEKEQDLFNDFLETQIFVKEAELLGLHDSEDLEKISRWERKRFLSKEYMEVNWFGDIMIEEAKLQQYFLDQRKVKSPNILSREALKKHLLVEEKRRLIGQNERNVLQEYRFILLDDSFEQDFL